MEFWAFFGKQRILCSRNWSRYCQR